MTKRLWTLPLVAVLLLAVGGMAHAIPSVGGPTGIVSVPTAGVAPMDELQTALTYQSQEIQSQDMYGGSVDVNIWALNVLAGVSDEAELWGAYAVADQELVTGATTVSETANMWAFGGKYQLATEPEDDTTVAVGAGLQKWSDMLAMYGGGTSDADVWNAYIVATKDFTPLAGEAWEWSSEAGTRMLGSIGILYISVDPDGGDRDSLVRPFIGFEFIGAGATTLGLEYRWKDSDLDQKAVFSAVLRHPVSPEVEMEIGTTNAGPGGLGLDDQDFFVRLGYNFPMGGP